MRGKLDLGNHKMANLFRPPAERRKWKRARRPKTTDAQYRQIWNLTAGAVRDCFACHPEYLTQAGLQAAELSLVKRVTGTLHGYATQVAQGRSIGVPDAARDLAAKPAGVPTGEPGHWLQAFLTGVAAWARALIARLRRGVDHVSPKISGGSDD